MTDFEIQVLEFLSSIQHDIKLIATVSLFALLYFIGTKILKSYIFKV